MAQTKKRSTRKSQTVDQIESFMRRVEAMEMRESMLKSRLDDFARHERGMQQLGAVCVQLSTMQCAIYDAIANLYDLLRLPGTADRMRSQKAELTKDA